MSGKVKAVLTMRETPEGNELIIKIHSPDGTSEKVHEEDTRRIAKAILDSDAYRNSTRDKEITNIWVEADGKVVPLDPEKNKVGSK